MALPRWKMGDAAVSDTRYFRSSAAVYEQIRAQLDSSYGYPSEATKTETSIPPADTLPKDEDGRVYLGVSRDYCDYILPSQMLEEMLASGAVEEVAEQHYNAVAMPPIDPAG